MKVFDLHCHPTLKPLLSVPKKRDTPWVDIKSLFKIYASQSNLKQILKGGCNIACVGLMAIEAQMLKEWLVKVLSIPVRSLDTVQIDNIVNIKPGCTYEDLLGQEINSVINNPVYGTTPTFKVKFINSINDYNAADSETLHLIGSLEGSHGMYSAKNQKQGTHGIIDDKAHIIATLESFKREFPIRLFYITLTHICQGAMANHAFAMKILPKKGFLPLESGITSLGHEVIKICQRTGPSEKPILIDIKHLSLVSRIQFYKAYNQLPIIASHMAVTGCSYSEKPIFKVRKKRNHAVYKVKYKKMNGYLPDIFFNPNSINLYDEDIVEILKSKGLIGLIFDERVLGLVNGSAADNDDDDDDDAHTCKEFVSTSEFNGFIAPDKPDYFVERDTDAQCTFVPGAAPVGPTATLCLLNNIMHIIKVGTKYQAVTGVDPLKHIVIGTDFDGMIDSVSNCPTFVQLPKLRKDLDAAIQMYAHDLIPNTDQFLDDFFYNNGLQFMKKNFV
jgi:microsomal dipeptidase-like Zn-dependent dipeptidase